MTRVVTIRPGIEADTLTILSGEQLVNAYTPPDGWHELFCSNCGSALFSRIPEDRRQ